MSMGIKGGKARVSPPLAPKGCPNPRSVNSSGASLPSLRYQLAEAAVVLLIIVSVACAIGAKVMP